jgi:biotin synthase
MKLLKEELIRLLDAEGEEEHSLFDLAVKVKLENGGHTVYLRGLIEFSNICKKNCYYCGIRKDNSNTRRYCLSRNEALDAIRFAYENGFGSVAIQSGEQSSDRFVREIDSLLKESMRITNGEIGITLSCGEQTEEVYRRWFESGASRYLLRIETSSEALYRKIHPADDNHRFAKRLEALESLKKTGYQTGTGVLIGLPSQTREDLADDLLFMKQFDIDMCGMGPYICHPKTPLYRYDRELLPLQERFRMTLRMIALLRILMPDINIAATTALQSIEAGGREKAILAGANVLMPNITPQQYRNDYLLYPNKPVTQLSDEDNLRFLEQSLNQIGHQIGYHQQGNSSHYIKKQYKRPNCSRYCHNFLFLPEG